MPRHDARSLGLSGPHRRSVRRSRVGAGARGRARRAPDLRRHHLHDRAADPARHRGRRRASRRGIRDVPVVWGGIHAQPASRSDASGIRPSTSSWSERAKTTLAELVQALETGTPLSTVNGIFYKEAARSTRRRRGLRGSQRQPPLSYHLLDMDLYRRRCLAWTTLTLQHQPRVHLPLRVLLGSGDAPAAAGAPCSPTPCSTTCAASSGLRHPRLPVLRRPLLHRPKRARGILEGIVRADLGITISKLQIRADTICRMDREFFELMVRAGVKRFTIGIESGSQRVLDLIKKDMTVEQAHRGQPPAGAVSVRAALPVHDGDAHRDARGIGQSIQLADRLIADNPQAVKTFNIYTPYPGTELFGVALERGLRAAGTAGGLGDASTSATSRRTPLDRARDQAPRREPRLPADVPRQPVHQPIPGHEPARGLAEPLVRARRALPRAQPRRALPVESKLVRSLGVFGRQG